MQLKKLIPELVNNLVEHGYDKEPKEIATLSVPKIKSSADLFIIAPKGAGKTTAAAIGVIQQLKRAEGEAPRAIIITETKEKAFAMEELIKRLSWRTKLRSFVVFDVGRMQYQKDMIYEGIDILIGTPNRINDLMSITGFPLSALRMLVVDDVEELFLHRLQHVPYRIADAVGKAQFVVIANREFDKRDDLTDRMMKNPITIKLDK